MIEIPLGLRHALESGDCVLFIGAGLGPYIKDANGKGAPDAVTLARELAEHFNIDIGNNAPELQKIAEIVEIRSGRTELETFVKKRLSNLEPDKNFQWLFTNKWRAIYTTNYDHGIERAYELITTPPQIPLSFSATSDLANYDPRFEVPIFHLHGTLFGESKPNIVITGNDYSKYREKRAMLFEQLKLHFATSTLLYIGYSHRDPNWSVVYNDIASEFFPNSMPRSFRVARNTDALDIEILKNQGLETITCAFSDFVEAASAALSNSQVDTGHMQQVRSSLPLDLVSEFEKSPAAVARLVASWVYVNQAPFSDIPNTQDFLSGDRPNWGLIGAREFFERDLEEEIYDGLLDYATSEKSRPRINTILAPAGYGVTTTLMTLAMRLIKDRVGAVFMLKPERDVIEGDIVFACTLFKDVFFIVDDAADNADVISSVIVRLRDSNQRAVFILGERLNEWRQAYIKPNGKEYKIDALSDSEIYRLIDYLRRNRALNTLEHLSPEMQFAAIKLKHGKELLVTMKEATEGKNFDAILEGEFHGIADPKARSLYLYVCFFYQHGVYIRDSLLAKLLNINLGDLENKTGQSTEGVVIYDCIDDTKELYGVRARHRTIASIVWARCGESAEKERIIQTALASLNLNFSSDAKAFENFVRSDRIVDSISTLDGKIRFFDTASHKDPDSPYVRQHYARMLLREDKEDLALLQINSAIEINPSLRVLYHTKGEILASLAMAIEGIEIARRRRAQSEECYRQCLKMKYNDEYGFQGLAKLFLDWAKRLKSGPEAVEFISKSEQIINEGLRKVKDREGLWIESANIQSWLGKEPSQITALEQAVQSSPGGVISRYLLGRAYRKSGQYSQALQVLEPIISNYHDEFRAFVEYAISSLYAGKTYKEAIAVMSLSTTYGLSDPRYIATLGGLYFLDHNFSDADKVFDESVKQEMNFSERNTIQFRAPNLSQPNQPLRLLGKIRSVRQSFALIDTPDYPRIFCPGSKFGGLTLRVGQTITFELAFAPKGSVADKPMLSE